MNISGENYFAGIAWDDNGIVSGFDSDNEAFMQIILTYGCNNSVLSYNETSATVTINSEPVVFNFTNGQLVPVTSAWQQGSTPMFFYRTVNDGSSDVTVVCDPEGKLYINDHDDYILRVNDGFAWSTGAASQTLITNCGGKVTMDVAAGDDNLMTVISMDDYTVVFTEDGDVTVGTITEWVDPQNLFYRVCPVNDIATPVIVNENGEVCYVDHDGNFSVLRYNVATGVITEDATDAIMTACEAFTGGSNELELSTDASGNTVYTNGDYHIAVNNSGVIVEGNVSIFNSTDVIAAVGAAQVFADQNCTKYASGSRQESLFVRLNRNFNETKLWRDGNNAHNLDVDIDTECSIVLWGNTSSGIGRTEPFQAGEVVPMVSQVDMANPEIIFRDE